jgi:hypothetical protein
MNVLYGPASVANETFYRNFYPPRAVEYQSTLGTPPTHCDLASFSMASFKSRSLSP